jgi:hypothetical protein
MIPKFVDQLDMVRFIRALPENANYRNMLNEDFAVLVPNEGTQKEMESLWKYLVHQDYSSKDVNLDPKSIEQFMIDLYQPVVDAHKVEVVEPVMKKSKKPKYIPERKNGCGFKGVLEGAVSVIQEGNRWFGYVGTSLVANSPNRKYVVERLNKRGFYV